MKIWRAAWIAGVVLAAGCGPPPTGKITIASSPPGATVTLNGKECAATPCNFELAPGDYPVVATLLNHQHVEETVTVTANGTGYKTLHLLPMLPTEEQARQLHLRSKPQKAGGAYVF